MTPITIEYSTGLADFVDERAFMEDFQDRPSYLANLVDRLIAKRYASERSSTAKSDPEPLADEAYFDQMREELFADDAKREAYRLQKQQGR
ncbi:hypothetical protein ACQ859_29375 [Roseateles chitinivorans]|uniref:hypothetical protein n=1 Tax=Roseateles chitinivorans TaxID=2917965 RepID=UPI003D665007